MKKCLNCGADNKNDNSFCSICGSSEFGEPSAEDFQSQQFAPPPPPAPAPYYPPPVQKKPFSVFDVLTILGFVSSLVGLVQIWVVLEPLAVITSIVGFFKGTRYKGLAAAGFVIAVIAFIIRLFITLYNSNIVGKWAIEGIIN